MDPEQRERLWQLHESPVIQSARVHIARALETDSVHVETFYAGQLNDFRVFVHNPEEGKEECLDGVEYIECYTGYDCKGCQERKRNQEEFTIYSLETEMTALTVQDALYMQINLTQLPGILTTTTVLRRILTASQELLKFPREFEIVTPRRFRRVPLE